MHESNLWLEYFKNIPDVTFLDLSLYKRYVCPPELNNTPIPFPPGD